MKKLVKVAVVAVGLFLAGSTVNAQQKFAHINSAELLQSMPEIKAADTQLQTFQKQKQTELQQMDAERQKKVQAYRDKEATLSQANKETVAKELETMAKEIGTMEQRMQETNEKARQEIAQKQQEVYSPIMQKAETAIKAVAKEKGFAYVFDSSQQSLVYVDGGEDILALVKTKLGISATTAATPKK
ncbi:OmpH family outer membrane protein [Arcticibacter tournemirensis]|uniref:OmpH family outer membrane protein n=1 Tax=Arcticibacter tournemirensis TaxID=699437 RepID=A0A4Q0M2G4_9SPHI|nr:OmpH family outer membrane protein [Arcticibacter tournemirensis]RXF67004.1 OmpH family outer membrane protein [Arcticibacter tournemirensis]